MEFALEIIKHFSKQINEVLLERPDDGFAIERNGKKYLVVIKHGFNGNSLPLSVVPRVAGRISRYKDQYENVFFVTDGLFHIDHINAVDNKQDIQNMLFVHKYDSVDAIGYIEGVING